MRHYTFQDVMTTRHYTECMLAIIRHYTFRGATTTRHYAEGVLFNMRQQTFQGVMTTRQHAERVLFNIRRKGNIHIVFYYLNMRKGIKAFITKEKRNKMCLGESFYHIWT